MDAIAVLTSLSARAENLSASALRVAIAIAGMCAERRENAIVCQLRDIAARSALSPGHARRSLSELNVARFAAVQRTGRGVKISILATLTHSPTVPEQTGLGYAPSIRGSHILCKSDSQATARPPSRPISWPWCLPWEHPRVGPCRKVPHE